MIRTLNAALILLLAASAARGAAFGLEASERGPVAAALGAHLAAVDGLQHDADAMADALSKRIEAPGASREDVLSGLALIAAGVDARGARALQAYLGPDHADVAARLDVVFKPLERDPLRLRRWQESLGLLESRLTPGAVLPAADWRAFWDGVSAAPFGGDAVAAAAPLERPSGLARYEPALQPQRKAVVPAPQPDASALRLELPKAQSARDLASGLSGDEERRAIAYVDELLSLDPMNYKQAKQGHGAAENYGARLQAEAAAQSRMLQKPLTRTGMRGSSTGDVGQALTALAEPMATLDPSRVEFDPGFLTRLLVRLNPWGKLPAERYAESFASSKEQIESIAKSLETSREGLLADIEALRGDQARMREIIRKLTHAIARARFIDALLDRRLASGELSDQRQRFVQDDVLFPLKQRILDLQQQLAVNQQGVLAAQIVIENNQTLARSVSRTINTIPAVLQVAALIANGLEGQRGVLEAVNATNKSGAQALENAARQAKNQGRALQDQAAASMLPVERLKAAYRDLSDALGDINRFKQEKLPQMSAKIAEFDELTRQGQGALERIQTAIDKREAKQ